MNSMPSSNIFCALTVSSGCLSDVGMDGPDFLIYKKILKLVVSYQYIVSLTSWWPTREVNGEACVEYVTGSGREKYSCLTNTEN